jgi:hypothetical protein
MKKKLIIIGVILGSLTISARSGLASEKFQNPCGS